MKIGILSRKESLYSTARLKEAGNERGHEVHVINPLRCYMNITSHHPAIHYKGEQLIGFDAIIPRIGASITFYGTAVVRLFEMMNVYCVNESVADPGTNCAACNCWLAEGLAYRLPALRTQLNLPPI